MVVIDNKLASSIFSKDWHFTADAWPPFYMLSSGVYLLLAGYFGFGSNLSDHLQSTGYNP